MHSQTNPIIVGGSVAGLALAGALAQRDPAQRVRLIAPPLVPNRRLIAGCSLRGEAIRFMAEAVGQTFPEWIQNLTGGGGLFHRVALSVGSVRNGEIRFDHPVITVADSGSPERPLGLSTRHGQILSALRAGVRKFSNLQLEERAITSGADLTAGVRIVNATPQAELFGAPPRPRARRFVIAAQVPCRVGKAGLRAPLSAGTGYAPFFPLPDGRHLSFFTPFADPLSPEATWYGINTKIVEGEFSRETELALVREHLETLCAALGLEPIDADETLGVAAAPIHEEADSHLHSPEVYNAYAGFESGAPAIAADGMWAMAKGARAFTESFAQGRDEARAVRGALRSIRLRNRATQMLMTQTPVPVTLALTRWASPLFSAMFRPGMDPLELQAPEVKLEGCPTSESHALP